MKMLKAVLAALLVSVMLFSAFACAESAEVQAAPVEAAFAETDPVELPGDAEEGDSGEAVFAGANLFSAENYDIYFYQKKVSVSYRLNVGDALRIRKYDVNNNNLIARSWKSSKPGVATIVDKGEYFIVTPQSAGKASITVKMYSGHSMSLKLTVVDPYAPTAVSLNTASVTMNIGQTCALTPSLSPSSAKTTFQWTTSKGKVATVYNGTVTAHAAGSAKITVKTANGKKAVCKVTVLKDGGSGNIKDLSNFDYRVVRSNGRGSLVFQVSPGGRAIKGHKFYDGDLIFVNVNYRKKGFALAYEDGVYGYVDASFIDWSSGNSDLSVYLGREISQTAGALGLTNKVRVAEYNYVYYYGNNIELTADNTTQFVGPAINIIAINGPSSYNLFGFSYGMSYAGATAKARNDGWQYDDEYDGADGHAIYYTRGGYELTLGFSGSKVNSVSVSKY